MKKFISTAKYIWAAFAFYHEDGRTVMFWPTLVYRLIVGVLLITLMWLIFFAEFPDHALETKHEMAVGAYLEIWNS